MSELESIDSLSEPLESYWVVVVDELLPPPPELRRFSSLVELVNFVKNVHRERKSAWVLPFFGDVLSVTEGGIDGSLRFLVDPYGGKIPLFDMPGQEESGVKSFYPAGGKKYVELLAKAMEVAEAEKNNSSIVSPPRRFEFIEEEDADDGSDLDFGGNAF